MVGWVVGRVRGRACGWVVGWVGVPAVGVSFLSTKMRLISPFFDFFNSVVLNCGKSPQFLN